MTISVENFSFFPTQDPLIAEAEKIAKASGQSPDEEKQQTDRQVALHARLMDWRTTEKERSREGRDQMSIDHDFRDGSQVSVKDAKVLEARGQDATVFNRVLPYVEWLVGTERRTRTDAKVLPRTKDDSEGARAQSDVMKYLADVNMERFHVSRAFDDAVTGGVGWIEDYVNPDPTAEPIACRYESWRYIWYDSASNEFDLSDARYVFRERWVDLDMAIAMFPQHAAHLKMIAQGYDPEAERTEQWFMGIKPSDWEPALGRSWNGYVYTTGGGVIRFGGRQRVLLIEFQYRAPERVQVFVGGQMNGGIFNKDDPQHQQAAQAGAGLFKTHRMRMRLCVMTERAIISDTPHPYRHDRFSFTPIWCYRRDRDNQPFGVVRNLRGIQEDINKRFWRSLYRMSSQQIIVDDDATQDWTELREQAMDPNGIVRVKRGARAEFRADFNVAEGDLKLMQQELLLFQESGGLTNENMGRETNATSGRAVLARQQQGSIIYERVFDNLRLATQLRGNKRLSMIRQFMTEARVLRLTDARGRASWLYVNQEDPETGQFNDIVSAQADFIVSEQDFRASMRMAMFDALMELLSRQPPEIAIQLLDLAMEVGDLPNQEEIVKRIRKINGQPDPDAQDSPEEQQRAMAAEQAAQAAAELQQRMAMAELAKVEAEAKKLEAEAQKALAEAGGDAGAVPPELLQQQQRMAEQLRQAQEALSVAKVNLANREQELLVRREEVALKREQIGAETARHQGDWALRREEISERTNAALLAASESSASALQLDEQRGKREVELAQRARDEAQNDAIKALSEQIAELKKTVAEQNKETATLAKQAASEAEKANKRAEAAEEKMKQAEQKAKDSEKQGAESKPAPTQPPIGTLVVNVPPAAGGKKSIKFATDDQGNVTGASIEADDDKPKK